MMFEAEVDIILVSLEDRIKYHKRKIKQLEDRFFDRPARINQDAVKRHEEQIKTCESAMEWMRTDFSS